MSRLGDGQPVHATLIAARRAGRWWGALMSGPSGAGKSALALDARAAGWALVADDRVRLWASGERLYGAAPRPLAGLIEARGVDVVCCPSLRFARLAVHIVADAAPAERIAEPMDDVVCGVGLPTFRLPLSGPAAVARLDLALDAALRRRRVL